MSEETTEHPGDDSWPTSRDGEAIESFPDSQETPKEGAQAPRLRMVQDYLQEGRGEAARRHHAYLKGTPLGPKVYLQTLAREIGGCLPQGVTVVSGSPGGGKTSLAHELCANAGCAAVVVSLEMTATVLIDRHLARATKTWLSDIRSGKLPPEKWEELFDETMAGMPHVGLVDGTRGGVSRQIISDAAQVAREESESDHLLLVIDSFHSWMRGFEPDKNSTSGDARINIERSLHGIGQLGSQLNASILLITEQSKASMDSDRQESSADSRVFAYISELVINLTRDRTIDADSNGEVPVLLTVGKNRHGAPGGRINLQFCGGKMTFRENPVGGRTIESDFPKRIGRSK
jgi:replicative DNA helicase